MAFAQKVANPPHCSVGIVQTQPTKAKFEEYSNPTNGRWWIVQVRPFSHSDDENSNFARILGSTQTVRKLLGVEAGPEPSTNCRWWDSESSQRLFL